MAVMSRKQARPRPPRHRHGPVPPDRPRRAGRRSSRLSPPGPSWTSKAGNHAGLQHVMTLSMQRWPPPDRGCPSYSARPLIAPAMVPAARFSAIRDRPARSDAAAGDHRYTPSHRGQRRSRVHVRAPRARRPGPRRCAQLPPPPHRRTAPPALPPSVSETSFRPAFNRDPAAASHRSRPRPGPAMRWHASRSPDRDSSPPPCPAQ